MFRKRREDDLHREIHAHLEEEASERVENGALPDAAYWAARRKFGNLTGVKEVCREMWGWGSLERLMTDIRGGLRQMAKNPAWSAVAVATLALGIGANTAIFSVVNTVLLQPLDYKDPEQLVTIWSRRQGSTVSPADFLDWKKSATTFSGMAAASGWYANLAGPDRTEQIPAMQVSDGMFEMLGVPPLLGRTFLPEEHQSGRDRVVVLSHRLWQSRFGGDVSIAGRTITINGIACTVAGVMPEHFQFAPYWFTDPQLWAPMTLSDRETDRGNHFLRVFGRIKPDVKMETAKAEIATISQRLADAYPQTNAQKIAEVFPLAEKVTGGVRESLIVLLAAVGFVLLTACANLANLSLVQASARQREFAIRTAMGAGHWRVMRQLITESLVLACIGGVFGMLLAWVGVDALKALIEQGPARLRIPRASEIRVDMIALLFTGALSIATGVVFGVFPALSATRRSSHSALKEGSRGSEGSKGLRTRGVLVVVELALSMVLLAGAGLLLRSFMHLRSLDPGFDPRNLLTMSVSLAGQPDYVGPKRAVFYRDMIQNLQALPGVRSAALVNHLPVGGDTWRGRVRVEGRPEPAPGEEVTGIYRVVSPNYFQTMRIQLLAGREFTDSDRTPVVIVNEKLAQRLFPGESAVGRRLEGRGTIIGVSRNVKQESWGGNSDNEFYVPLAGSEFMESPHFARSSITVVIRTSFSPVSLTGAAKSVVWSLNKEAPVSAVRSMDEVAASSMWQTRFYLLLLGLFAALALVLAAVGIYGVMAFAVSRRTREIGIRIAMGARRREVIWMVLKQGMQLVLLGVAVGACAAFAAVRGITSMLHGVKPSDPLTFALIPVVLVGAAAIACLVPARRASSVDPMVALRAE